MEENLVGYLLKSLGTEEQRAVEDHMRRHPEAKKRLEQLRRGLDVLGTDGVEPEPPPDLWVRTLARVAEYKCRTLPAVPAPAARTAPAWGSWWRRADVLVAACLLLLVGGLGVIGMAAIAAQRHVTECQDNLRKFHQALTAYADKHEDRFPWVESQAPKNFAGSFIPALNEAGVLPSDITVSCPGSAPRAPAPVTFAQLEEMYNSTRRAEYFDLTRSLAGCYAYSLGYREAEAGPHYGLTRRMDGRLPIMADAPPSRGANEVDPGNSLNHGGKGQNVLFIDGHVEFLTTRTIADDDIYLNAERRVAAGRGPGDVVLGRSDAVLDE
jgi:prepilin-type processing-associated H-X9-DG protein